MSILGNLNKLVENKKTEAKTQTGLKAEQNTLKVKVKNNFTQLGIYIINNVELWHDSHPQLAIEFMKLREIIELKRTYNILKANISDEGLQQVINKLKQDKDALTLVSEYFRAKNQEINDKLAKLQRDKEVIAENIGKTYFTHQLFKHIPGLLETYKKVSQQLHELQMVQVKIENQPKQGLSQEQAIGRFIEEIWPNLKVEAHKGNISLEKANEKLSLLERIKVLEEGYIYENPGRTKDKKEVPKGFLDNWEWNDSLPWQKPFSILGRNEVYRIEHQRYLGWIEKGKTRKKEKLIDCRKCQFRKPIESKYEYYCSIIPNCNDQNAERFRHGEMAKGCNYFKPLRKRYTLHKIKGNQ
jgi:hypothetical protein